MVILFVTPYLGKKGEVAKGGGLETYLLRVTGALKQMGHTPIILAFGARDMHYMNDEIEIYFTRAPQGNSFANGKIALMCDRVTTSATMNRKVREIVKQKNVDIIQFPSPYALSLCYFGKTPAVMRLSSYSKVYSNYKEFDKLQMNVWGLCERLAAARCKAVFAPSNVIARIFAKDIHRKVFVIESPFWNDCKKCDDRVYQEKLADKKYFLFFGRLGAEKGALIIAEILQCFLKSHSEYYFVCCGSDTVINGEHAAHTLKTAAGAFGDRFIYVSALPHEMLYPIVQHADFVICPSLIENFSNTCIEAMYFKRVVIGTEGTSYEQLIEDGVSGLLCMPGDAESLLEKMNEAAAMDKMQQEKIGEMARRRIDRLAPECTVSKLIRFYQRVIAGN